MYYYLFREVDQGAKFIVDVNGDTLSITNTKVRKSVPFVHSFFFY